MNSKRYKQIEYTKSMKSISEEMLELWGKNNTINEIISDRSGEKDFVFLEGPPTANGRPHVGHAMTRTIKDTVLRYKRMTGHRIYRRTGGWDCHGLPVELEAEKYFGFKTKKEIEDYGLEKFNQYCRESVFKYIDEWRKVDGMIGFWVDQDNAYVTLRNDYIESEWWALKTLFDRGMLVKDYKIVPYCPRCETSLSSHEVSQGYDEVKDPSVYVKFRESGYKNRYFIAWTTTPWTLPSNEFLAVNPRIEYSLVEMDGEEYYIASDVVPRVLKEGYKIIERFTGQELVGKEYEQLLPFLAKPAGTMKVVGGDHVTVEDGSGIVHTSPAFGADDFDIGKSEGVDILNPVNLSGRFSDEKLPWKGLFVKDADIEIIKHLKKNGLLLKSEKIVHTYPFCYRCSTPLLYYPLEAWFIRVSEIRKKLIENNSRINWLPDYIKDGRFGNFLSEAKDWSLSRNRFWGTPLPVWTCKNGHHSAIGGREDLKKLGGEVPEDLHRPYIDDVVLKCPVCEEDMKREPYVIDTWFDSGSATYAAMHYPFEKGFSPDSNFPIDFISEAIDQTRGWFYTLHTISSLLFDSNAYKNAVVIGFVLDEQGRKMSKSKGNSVFALDFLNELGPDPVRLFFLNGAPWKDRAIDKKLISEITRKTLGTLTNIYSFFASNANIDNYEYEGLLPSENLLDRWLISRVNSTVKNVRGYMDSYEMHLALRDIQDLIEDFSNFYLRLSRRRFWSEEMDEPKKTAYSTLYFSLLAILKMLAPITPFFSDYLYLNLTNSENSIHRESFPVADESSVNADLEKHFSVALSVIESVRRIRQESNIKGRQPVTEILISYEGKLPEEIIEIIRPEVNCRSLKFIKESQKPLKHEVKLVLSKAAPVLKSEVRNVMDELTKLDPESIVGELNERGAMKLAGKELGKEFFEIINKPEASYGYNRDEKSGVEVFLNREIDEELLKEGLAREIIRRIQVMRKEMDLEYYQRIVTSIEADRKFVESIDSFRKWIMDETLSDELVHEKKDNSREWDIDGEKVKIFINPV